MNFYFYFYIFKKFDNNFNYNNYTIHILIINNFWCYNNAFYFIYYKQKIYITNNPKKYKIIKIINK